MAYRRLKRTAEKRFGRSSPLQTLRIFPTGNGSATEHWKAVWRFCTHVATAVLAIFGVLLGLNEYEAARLDRRRDSVEKYYSDVLEGLGSSSEVVRIGAIGRIPKLVTSRVPREDRPTLWEGALFFAGLHSHPTYEPFHEDLLRVISALVAVTKDAELASAREGEAIISMLCELGPNGWYRAEIETTIVSSNDCLAWVWQSAPDEIITRRPAYDLFKSSSLRSTPFSQMQLERAEFSNSNLGNCMFDDADLRRASFRGAKIVSTSFVNAILTEASFERSLLRDVDFAGADLTGAVFTDAEFNNVRFKNSRNLHLAIGLPRVVLDSLAPAVVVGAE